MKTIRIILWLSLLSMAPALFAQTAANRTSLNTLVDSRLPSGTGGLTAANLRLMFKDVIASGFNTINADAQPINANLTGFGGLANAAGWLHNDGAGVFTYSTPTGGVWGSITGTLSSQTDLNTALGLKAPLASPTFTGTVTLPTPFTLGAVSVTATGTQLNFVDATSSIQTQLNGKQASLGFTPVANTVTVNGHALSANVTVTPGDLSLVIGTNVQAYSANLTTFAGIAPSANVQSILGASNYGAVNTLLGTFANPMTTAGDIIIGGASGVPTRQAQGGNGTFWGVSGGVAGYYTPAGGGNVSNSGTPTSGQIATWTASTVIQGVGASTLSDSILGGLATTGLVKRTGANAYAIATAGTDYLTPSGSAASLTSFPTFNQNTTGTAANLSGTPALPNGTTATTQTVGDNTTKLATTAFVLANAGSVTLANPTATIGLTANNGAATTAMRSDASPALGVGIAPHWTGQHWFDLNPRITDNTAPTTGTSALALGTNYTLNGLTANYSFTSVTGTSGRSKVHLVGCDGTHTFTWTTAAQRAGDPVGTSTTITPTAGDHTYVFYYDTVTSALYYADDQTAVYGTGVAAALAINVGSAGAPVLFNGAGGTPTSLTLTNATGLPLAGGGTGGTTAATARVALNVTTNAVSASAIDWSLSGSHSKTLAANTTFTFSNATDGETIIVALTNTTSNWTVTWPTVSWSGGTAPTQTVGAHTDVYTFTKIGTTIYGSAVQNF